MSPSKEAGKEKEASACIITVRWLFQKRVHMHRSMIWGTTSALSLSCCKISCFMCSANPPDPRRIPGMSKTGRRRETRVRNYWE